MSKGQRCLFPATLEEGHTAAHIKSVVAYVQSHRQLIKDFMSGRIEKDGPVGTLSSGVVHAPVTLPAKAWRMPIHSKYAAMIPHRKDVEGRINMGKAAQVQESEILLLGCARARVLHIHHFDSFQTMLEELGVGRALPGIRTVAEGVEIYHSIRNYERKALQFGVVAFELGPVEDQCNDVRLYGPQQRAFTHAWDCVERAFQVHEAKNEEACDVARNNCYDNNKIQVLLSCCICRT